MTENSTKYKMGQLLTVKHGFPFLGEYFSANGEYIVLTPGNFFESGGFKRTIGKEKFYNNNFPQEYLLKKGDLVVAMTEQAEGLLGSTAIIPENNLYLHNQRIGLITENTELIDKLYLYYLFMTSSVRKQIRDTSSGTKVKHTSPERIYDVTVFIPSKNIQVANAELLYKIDQKIELNNRIKAELEAMAKTIYDYWFTQFDFPNADSKPYKSLGGEMVWNEELKREIPKGWAVRSIKEIEENIITGKTPSTNKSEFYNGNIPFITIGDIRDNMFVVYTEQTLTKLGADSQPTKFIPEDSICVTCIASPGLVSFSTRLSQTNQQINTVVCKNEYNKLFLYFAIKNHFDFSRGAKTGNVFANMNKGEFESVKLVYPKKEIVNKYHKKTASIMKKIKLLSLETQELTKLKDWLIPMLMNGQATAEE
jgi:type I restriction enzyme S subunit